MPGTYAQDALAPNLLVGSTLNAAGTTTSTPVQLDWPRDVMFELTSATATGTTPTLNVEVQGADDAGFTVNVVSFGRFAPVTTVTTRKLSSHVGKKYVRASVVAGGTSPSFAGSTLYPRVLHDRRTDATQTA